MPVTETFDPFDAEQGRRHHEATAVAAAKGLDELRVRLTRRYW